MLVAYAWYHVPNLPIPYDKLVQWTLAFISILLLYFHYCKFKCSPYHFINSSTPNSFFWYDLSIPISIICFILEKKIEWRLHVAYLMQNHNISHANSFPCHSRQCSQHHTDRNLITKSSCRLQLSVNILKWKNKYSFWLKNNCFGNYKGVMSTCGIESAHQEFVYSSNNLLIAWNRILMTAYWEMKCCIWYIFRQYT